MKKSTFVAYKTLKLDFLGEGWENAYLKFKDVPYSVLTQMSEEYGTGYTADELKNDPQKVKEANTAGNKFLKDFFVEGKGFNGESLIEVTKDNLPDLPARALVKAVDFLTEKSTVDLNA